MGPSPNHVEFGHQISAPDKLKTVKKTVIADTGCMSTAIPPRFVYEAGFRKKDFIPVVSKINGAGGTDLSVQGAVVMEFTCAGPDNKVHSTKQLCYVCNRVDKVYMSRQGLMDLHCISPQFPLPMPGATVATTDCHEEDVSKCDCPSRPAQPPPLPTKLPTLPITLILTLTRTGTATPPSPPLPPPLP